MKSPSLCWSVVCFLLMTLDPDVATLRRTLSVASAADVAMSASQCSSSSSSSSSSINSSNLRLNLRCLPGNVIHISRSFHGTASADTEQCGKSTGNGSIGRRCSYCDGDCIDESVGVVYDWSSSSCTGRQTCSRAVLQSNMPLCMTSPPDAEADSTSMTSDSRRTAAASPAVRPSALRQGPEVVNRFSDYLHVDYDCVDRSQMIDVCGEPGVTRVFRGSGHLVSPGYLADHAYPSNADCMCRLEMVGSRSTWTSVTAEPKLQVAIYDMLLGTNRGRCQADWVMIRLPTGEKHRHCGAISTGSKLVATSYDAVDVQFHSDDVTDDNLTHTFSASATISRPMKGFWLHFFTVPVDSTIHVTCNRLNSSDPRVVEIRNDDVISNRRYANEMTTSSSPLSTRSNELSKEGITTQRMTSREARLTFFGFGGCSHDNASVLLTVICLTKALVTFFLLS